MTRRRDPRKRGRKPPVPGRRDLRATWGRRLWPLVAVAVCGGIATFLVARSLWRPDEAPEVAGKPQAEQRRPAASKPPPPEPATGPAGPAQGPPKPPTGPSEPEPVPPEPKAVPPEPSTLFAGAPGPAEVTEQGLKQEAKEALTRLVKDLPRSPDPMGLMGELYVALGNTAEAIKCWEKCIELDPGSTEAYRRMAEIALRKGRFEEAAALSRKVLQIDPTKRGVHNQLAQALIGLSRPEEAIAELEKDIKISPRASLSYFLLGHAHQQLKEYQKAKEDYSKALEVAPTYTEASYGLSIVCERLGQKEEAAKYREMFKRLKARDWKGLSDPRDSLDQQKFLESLCRGVAETHTNVGLVYRQHGSRSKAEAYWRRAAVLDPSNTVCREELASLCAGDGRNREALRLYDQLRAIAPKNPQYLLNTGILYARMHQRDAALAAVKEAVELAPGNASYRRIYERMKEGI